MHADNIAKKDINLSALNEKERSLSEIDNLTELIKSIAASDLEPELHTNYKDSNEKEEINLSILITKVEQLIEGERSREIRSQSRHFSKKNMLETPSTRLLNRFENWSFSDSELSFQKPHSKNENQKSEVDDCQTDLPNMPSFEDFAFVKNYIDLVLEFEDFHLKRKQHEEDVQTCYTQALIKSACEYINLKKKGQNTNTRFIHISKNLSINSVNISKDARKAREIYFKAAKFYNEMSTRRKPIANEMVQKSFMKIANASLICPEAVDSKTSFPLAETLGDVQNITYFTKILHNLEANEK